MFRSTRCVPDKVAPSIAAMAARVVEPSILRFSTRTVLSASVVFRMRKSLPLSGNEVPNPPPSITMVRFWQEDPFSRTSPLKEQSMNSTAPARRALPLGVVSSAMPLVATVQERYTVVPPRGTCTGPARLIPTTSAAWARLHKAASENVKRIQVVILSESDIPIIGVEIRGSA